MQKGALPPEVAPFLFGGLARITKLRNSYSYSYSYSYIYS